VTCEDARVEPGTLDGVTIMRYAHIYRDRTSGGVEQYLRHLDRGLLARHRLTILQMHLVKSDGGDAVEKEKVGIGQIIWVPVAIRQTESRLRGLPERLRLVRRTLRLNHKTKGRTLPASAPSFRSVLTDNSGHFRYKAAIFSGRLHPLVESNSVDLLSVHWMSYDTAAVIRHVQRAGVPFVFINHFDNSRLASKRLREQIRQAAAIGVISNCGIPAELNERCVNLSDAVDTEFFDPERAQIAEVIPRLVLLPARIETGKGHRDLINAARVLINRGVDITLGFVGAVDSEAVHRELRQSAASMGMEGHIRFFGEVSAERVRDWYASSAVVVLPSHSEGLGRVLLEAQAMARPVVAYNTGGVPEALVPDGTGYLVEVGNVEVLADKIEFLLTHPYDATRMGVRGQEFVRERFGAAALVQRHEKLYFGVLSGVSQSCSNVHRST